MSYLHYAAVSAETIHMCTGFAGFLQPSVAAASDAVTTATAAGGILPVHSGAMAHYMLLYEADLILDFAKVGPCTHMARVYRVYGTLVF